MHPSFVNCTVINCKPWLLLLIVIRFVLASVGGLAGGQAFAERGRQGGEILVLERLHLRFERIGSIDQVLVLTQQALVAATKEASEELEHDEESFRQGMEAT